MDIVEYDAARLRIGGTLSAYTPEFRGEPFEADSDENESERRMRCMRGSSTQPRPEPSLDVELRCAAFFFVSVCMRDETEDELSVVDEGVEEIRVGPRESSVRPVLPVEFEFDISLELGEGERGRGRE